MGEDKGKQMASHSGQGHIEAEGIPEASTLLAQLYESKTQENPDEMDLRLSTLKDTFDLFDKDGDGSIDVDEFQSLLSVIGMDSTYAEADDLVSEVDSDGSKRLEFTEFLMLIGKQKDNSTNELEGAWEFLDPDGDGQLPVDQLKDLVLRSGIRLDMWEVKQMVDAADVNKDGMIDKEEFLQAVKGEAWSRCKRLGEIYGEVKDTWAMMMPNTKGEIDYEHMKALFTAAKCPVNDDEMRNMLGGADGNRDGKINFQEFACAYHSKLWRRVRLLAPLQKRMLAARSEQNEMYAAWRKEEWAASEWAGLSFEETQRRTSLERLRARRMLKSKRAIRHAIYQIWEATASARQMRDDNPKVRDWIEKDLYYTMWLHWVKHFNLEEFCAPVVRGMLEEEWTTLTTTPVDITILTLHQKRRANLGDLRWINKPENLVSIGYGKFFTGIFACVDSEVGFGQNDVTEESYQKCIEEMRESLVRETPDGYEFIHPELVQGSCPKSYPKVELVRTASTLAEEEEEEVLPDMPLERDVPLDPECEYARLLHEHIRSEAANTINRVGRGYIARMHLECRSWIKKVSPAEFRIFKSDFNKIDKGHKGFLEKEEVAALIKSQMDREPTKAEIDKIFTSMDLNKGGTICLREYISHMFKDR